MRKLVVFLMVVAGCDGSGRSRFCQPAEGIKPCTDCARGEVRSGAVVRTDGMPFVARPAGGWAWVCNGHVRLLDADATIAREIDLDLDGWLDVVAVGPDDTAYVSSNTSDDFDDDLELVAIAADGGQRWRLDLGRLYTDSSLAVTPLADVVYLSGVPDPDLDLGGAQVHGLFVARLDASDGSVEWIWSAPVVITSNGARVAVAPRADGSVVVAGTFEATTVDLGGATAPLADDGISGFVGVLDEDGRGVWSRQLEGPRLDGIRLVDVTSDGAIAIAGDFRDAPLDLGNGVVVATSSPYWDQFVALLEPDGTARWAAHLGDWISEPLTSLVTWGDALVVSGSYDAAPLGIGDDVVPDKTDAYIASVTGGAIDWVSEVHGTGYERATVTAAAGALGALISNASIYAPGLSFDAGRVHVDGFGVMLAELVP